MCKVEAPVAKWAKYQAFTVREYARIQTFPDEWKFEGSVAQQYKQIGNAVPVNLGREVGYSIVNGTFGVQLALLIGSLYNYFMIPDPVSNEWF